MTERKLIQDVYIRVCRDSGFRESFTRAAKITATLLGIHPLQVWVAFGRLETMEEVAAGTHPAVREEPT